MTATLHAANSCTKEELGLFGSSPLYDRLTAAGLTMRRKLAGPERMVRHEIEGVPYRVALPLTFTPFASVKPCSARCVFCSETLIHKESTRLSATLRPRSDYFEGLERALKALQGLPLSYSLSGLEATDDASWLCRVLDLLGAHEDGGGPVEEKVLYTNGNGLSRGKSGGLLLPRLRAFGLTRAEFSRHHPDAARNDQIMRFRADAEVRSAAVFERTVKDALDHVPVRLVCVLQRGGVDDGAEVRRYLAWADSLGVRDVVFREFSRLGDLYHGNRTSRHIESHRVVLERLLDEIWPDSEGLDPALEPLRLTAGYYYWNLRCRWRGRVDVTFETSDYTEMKTRHRSGDIYKLIFHANGNLCGDWDPDKQVLLRTGQRNSFPAMIEV